MKTGRVRRQSPAATPSPPPPQRGAPTASGRPALVLVNDRSPGDAPPPSRHKARSWSFSMPHADHHPEAAPGNVPLSPLRRRITCPSHKLAAIGLSGRSAVHRRNFHSRNRRPFPKSAANPTSPGRCAANPMRPEASAVFWSRRADPRDPAWARWGLQVRRRRPRGGVRMGFAGKNKPAW